MQRSEKLANRYCNKKIPKNTHKNIFDIHDIDIRDIYYTLNCSVSSSRSISGFELQHPDPRQLPQATEQFSPCFLQEHLSVLQSVWQLHLTIRKSSFGAGSRSVVTGVCHHSLSNPSLVETFQPQYLATALSDSRHADCDTLLQKMLEVVSGGEHSNLSLLLCRNIFCISVSQDFFPPFHCTK